MTYKTILLVVGVSQFEDDLRAAADLCASEGAHLSVLASRIATLPPMGDFAAISTAWIDSRDSDLEQLRHAVREANEILGSAGISFDVVGRYSETMRLGQDIGERARYADVTLIGTSLRVDELLRRGVIEGALFYSARPVLLASDLRSATLQPKNVLVAWNSTVESARAVRETLDMMRNAEGVNLVLVDPKTKNGEDPGADVATYLARHGVKVTVDRLPSAGRTVEEVPARTRRFGRLDRDRRLWALADPREGIRRSNQGDDRRTGHPGLDGPITAVPFTGRPPKPRRGQFASAARWALSMTRFSSSIAEAEGSFSPSSSGGSFQPGSTPCMFGSSWAMPLWQSMQVAFPDSR